MAEVSLARPAPGASVSWFRIRLFLLRHRIVMGCFIYPERVMVMVMVLVVYLHTGIFIRFWGHLVGWASIMTSMHDARCTMHYDVLFYLSIIGY